MSEARYAHCIRRSTHVVRRHHGATSFKIDQNTRYASVPPAHALSREKQTSVLLGFSKRH